MLLPHFSILHGHSFPLLYIISFRLPSFHVIYIVSFFCIISLCFSIIFVTFYRYVFHWNSKFSCIVRINFYRSSVGPLPPSYSQTTFVSVFDLLFSIVLLFFLSISSHLYMHSFVTCSFPATVSNRIIVLSLQFVFFAGMDKFGHNSKW